MIKSQVNFIKVGQLELSDPEPADQKLPLESFTATLRKGSMHATVTVPNRGVNLIVSVFREIEKGTSNTGMITGQDVLNIECHREKDGTVTADVALRNFIEKWSVEAKIKLELDEIRRITKQLKQFFRVD